MEQSVFSFTIDKDLKSQFDLLCENFGITASTAINMLIKSVVREKKIPFEILDEKEITREKAMQVFYALREEAKNNNLQDMTLEEINKEIELSRIERKNL